MIRPNPTRSILFVLAGAIALYLALGMLGRILVAVAHAAPAPTSTLQPVPGPIAVAPATAPALPADSGLDWRSLLAMLAGVLAGVSVILHVVAPRTKTTIDDRLRDDLDEVLAFIRGGAQPPTSAFTLTRAPRDPQAGRVSVHAILIVAAVAALGVSIGALLAGCTAAQRTAVKHSIIDCTAPARSELVAATTPLAVSAIRLATNPDGSIDDAKLKAYFKPANLLSEAGVIVSCAAIAAFRELRSAPADTLLASSGPAQATTDALAAAELEIRAPWGGATFRIAGGVR